MDFDGPAATQRLFAEVIALRIALQRTMAHLGSALGDMSGFLASEHRSALDDLTRMEINDFNETRATEIRMMAESVLDQMYTTMQQGTPPKP